MVMMEERSLEVNILSAQDLKKVSHFGTDTDYVVTYIHQNDKRSTGVDRHGGNNPTWNAKFTLTCDEKLLHKAGWFITLEIYSLGSFSNKLVGTAKVSLQEVGKQIREAYSQPQRLSFEVRRPSGKVKGVINVSVKVGEKRTVDQLSHYAKKGWSSNLGGVGAYPPPKSVYDAVYPPVYPPQKGTSDLCIANPDGVYPPPRRLVDDSNGKAPTEEPVMAYPVAYPAYPPQQYAQHYAGPYYPPQQQYYYPADPNHGYGYQQLSRYGQSSKDGGSSSGGGLGLGLLGGVLGGLLLGDVIGGGF